MAQFQRIRRYIPIFGWLASYKREYVSGDLSSGVVVGVLLIPQGMAYAMIAGLPPVYGLYAAIVPQLVYAIFGTSSRLSVGPVAMDSMIVASGVSFMAVSGTDSYIALAAMLAFFVGLFQITLGGMQLGFITNLLSRPVISGFTTAVAIIIIFSQLKLVLGVNLFANPTFQFSNLSQIHLFTFSIAIFSGIAIKVLTGLFKMKAGIVIVVLLCILLSFVFGFEAYGVTIVREIPAGFPLFSLPKLELSLFIDMWPLAFTLAALGFVESYAIGKALVEPTGKGRIYPNQELFAIGAANIIGSLFQSFPVAGSFSRSAVNAKSGANTPIASMISALVVLLVLLFFTSLFYYLPVPVLGAVIIVSVANLIDWRYALLLIKMDIREFAIFIGTVIITIVMGVVPGIVTGVGLSIVLLLYSSAYPHIAVLGRLRGSHEFRNVKRFQDLEQWPHIVMIRIDAPLRFINIQYVKDRLQQEIKSTTQVQYILIDASPISHIDASATKGIADITINLKARGIRLIWCDVKGPMRDAIYRNGLIDIIGHENMYLDLSDAIRSVVKNEESSQFASYAHQSKFKN